MAGLFRLFLDGGAADCKAALLAQRPLLLQALEPAKQKKDKPDELIISLIDQLASL
jgi:hypothetical protein